MRILDRKIIFTGGGSAGHVIVNLALMPKFIEDGWNAYYIGSEKGIEKQLIDNLNNVHYFSIATGKLRRYFDWNNFKDPFKVVKGVYQAYKIIREVKPNVIFSKGGFVSVPVVIGGWLNRIPIIIHESDITPGLANKIAIPFATKVCTTFSETKQGLNKDKVVYVGAIVREELLRGNADKGLSYCSFSKKKPVLLVMGGSLGAKKINGTIRANLTSLLTDFQIVHICGKGNIDPSLKIEGYKQFEYINQELPHIMAMSDLVVSRAGSNSIFEFLALNKPMLLIPLSKKASRGDQILNAKSFQQAGFSEILLEENLTDKSILEGIYKVYKNKEFYIKNMQKRNKSQPMRKIIKLINNLAGD